MTTVWALYIYFITKATGEAAVRDMRQYFTSHVQCVEVAKIYNENKEVWPEEAEINVFYYCTQKKNRES